MISRRAEEVSPFLAVDVFEQAQELERKGEQIIHLEFGEPDFETPEVIREAAIRALRDGRTKYTHSLGILPLREAIAEHYLKSYGIVISPDQILVTAGSSPAMLLLFAGLLDPGDEVILSDPHYACYPNFVRATEGISVNVPVWEDDAFQFRPEAIKEKITRRTKAIMINSPANPTGTLLAPDRMAAIASLGPWVISDEIYHGLVYEGRERSILEYTDRAFVLNGFSKAFAMTGWRLGYLIAPKAFIRPLQKLEQNFFISVSDFIQWAGVTALREAGGEVVRMRGIFNQRRRVMVDGLRALGFGIAHEPTGAFYVLANAKRFTQRSYDFAFEILRGAKVAVTPGIDFGQNAEGYLRFSYARSLEQIQEAMARIGRFLKETGRG